MANEPVANEIATPTSAATPAAASGIPVPEVNAPVPGGDTAILAPTSQPSLTGTQEYQGAVQGERAALENVQKLSQPAPPAAPVPHERLLNMIHGLAIGLSAAATSIGTGGREGGAKEVVQIQGEERAQKQAAIAATQAQKNQQIQQQLTVADTNHKLAQNVLLLATLPDEITKSHVSAEAAQVGLAGEKFNLFAGTGMTPADINKLTSGGNVDAKTSDMLKNNAQQQYRLASQLLSPDNPSLAGLKTVLDDPNSTPAQLVIANKRLAAEVAGQKDITADKIKQAEAAASAPFGARADQMNAAMLRRYKVSNPSAKELPADLALSPTSTPKDFDRADKILQQTENAQQTKANQDVVHAMRQEQIDMMRGVDAPGDLSKQGVEYLATLPGGMAGTVKEIGEGRGAPPPAGSRSSAAQMLNAALNHAYPDYDASKYPSYLDLRKKFTSGPEAKGINALNTVETHLRRMYDHATAPGTSGGITGKVTGFFGDKDVRALDIDRTAVATELSKAYAAGQISEGEVKDWEKKLDFTTPGMTTGKLITNLKEIDGLLEGKQKAYQSQWDAGAPSKSIVSPIQIINSDAASARATIRGEAPQAIATAKTLPPGVPQGSKLMQVPGGQPHWMSPDKITAAQKLGATEVQ